MAHLSRVGPHLGLPLWLQEFQWIQFFDSYSAYSFIHSDI